MQGNLTNRSLHQGSSSALKSHDNKAYRLKASPDNDCFNNFLVNLTSRSFSQINIVDKEGDDSEFTLSPEFMSPQSRPNQLNVDHIALHNLRISKHDNRFRKSWGNFVNIFNDQGEQKFVISRGELSNFLILSNYAQTESSFQFYATLFAGNYPKPVYNSATSNWRMRYNLFVGNVFNNFATTASYNIRNFGDEQLWRDDSEILLHLGELHIYFNVEPGCNKPVYHNLCFFFDNNLANLTANQLEKNGQLKQIGHLLADSSFLAGLQAKLKRCSARLRNELMCRHFIEQLFFPIHSSLLNAAEEPTCVYFDLRQIDLKTALHLFNQPQPFAFLHRASVV